MESQTRPKIATIKTGVELKRWYWLKDELSAYAKVVGVKTTGAKFVILDRIAHFLDTGETVFPSDSKPKKKSKFDWHTHTLTRDTLITDSYKNSQNVRRFFKSEVGDSFKFNIAFMAWIKSNVGKPLSAAVDQYLSQQKQYGQKDFKTKIKSHNQFNQYTRDFLNDNPSLGMDDVRRIWALKRALPSDGGRHTYAATDLKLES